MRRGRAIDAVTIPICVLPWFFLNPAEAFAGKTKLGWNSNHSVQD